MHHLLALIATTLAIANVNPALAASNEYPARPVRMIVPYPPGGGSDITGRAIGAKLGEYLGQTFVIYNRPGATGLIGTLLASRAPADGYTILLADAPHTINSLVYSKQQYDAIKDFSPIILIASTPYVLTAHPSLPVKNVKDLVALAKRKPGSLNYSSSGIGGFPHLNTELFKMMAGVDMAHVPFKGAGPAVADTQCVGDPCASRTTVRKKRSDWRRRLSLTF